MLCILLLAVLDKHGPRVCGDEKLAVVDDALHGRGIFGDIANERVKLDIDASQIDAHVGFFVRQCVRCGVECEMVRVKLAPQ